MLLQLDPASSMPLYRQILSQMRQLISTGALPVGERLPPSRELATRLGVHRTTVANAYAELAADGWIAGHVGRGTFVTGSPHAEETARPERSRGDGIRRALPPREVDALPPYTARLDNGYLWPMLFADSGADDALEALVSSHALAADPHYIPFTLARPAEELFPVEEFRRATSEVLRREGRALLQLGPSDGYPPLKDYLRQELRREGVQAGERELLITNGCQQALDLVRKVFLRPGDTVALENPVYPGAIQTFSGSNIQCLGVPVGEEGLNLDILETLLARHRVRLLLVTPSFHNPTGATLSLDARKRLLEIVARHRVPVVEDNIYGALRLRGRETPSLKALDTAGLVIHLNSFSKVCFPGLRVGWMVASAPVIERLRVAKQATDLHTDQLAQAALAEFGRRGLVTRLVKKARQLYRVRLERLEAALAAHFPEEVQWVSPEGGMAVWVRLPEGLDASQLLFKARERRVLFTPGRYFYFQGVEPNTLRLGFSAVPEKKIAQGIEILGDLIKSEMRQRQRQPSRREAARVALV